MVKDEHELSEEQLGKVIGGYEKASLEIDEKICPKCGGRLRKRRRNVLDRDYVCEKCGEVVTL